MKEPKVIAYDLGTGGIKASLFSVSGNILSSVFIPYSTCFPQKDWQEQAPEDWWEAVVCSTRQLLKQSSIPPEEIVSLAISGHSLGVVPIGKDGRLLRKTTPIWSDQRATPEAEDFFTRIDYQTWYEHTGNGFPPACYSVFKIMWYRNHEPEMFAKIHQVIGTKDYCNYRFTGRLCTDASYASGSGVFNLHTWQYEADYIRATGLDASLFPEILSSDAVIGTLTEEAARETGLNPATKVMAGGVDNSCMALGAGGIRAGEVYTSLGSSAWIALIDDKPILDFQRKPYVFAHLIPGLYTSATCIFSAGNSYRWVRDTLCMDLLQHEKETGVNAYVQMDKLAATSVPGSNGVCFNPSLAGGSMLEPSPFICGAFAGLQLGHTRADLIRAAMEGIALNLRVALDLLQSYSPVTRDMLIVGGGAKSPFWMQLFADIYHLPIVKTNIDQEAASLGAAALALKGIGLWSDYQPISQLHQVERRYQPQEETALFYQEKILPRFRQLTQLLGTFI